MLPCWPFHHVMINSRSQRKKKGYVLPDSLLKTIEIDTVTSSRVLNTLTLTGKVDFNEDNVIKMFPTISGQVSDIKVMPGDLCKTRTGACSNQKFGYGWLQQ